MKNIDIPEFSTNKELFDFLIKNKNVLMAQKKAIMKYTDFVSHVVKVYEKEDTTKELSVENLDSLNEITASVVMNTTNVIDSHLDLHIEGIWNKTLKENKMLLHLQEHQMKFDSIISDGVDLKAKVENTTFKALGYNLEGNTQALVFVSKIKKDRNEFMFEQYGKGYVKNHSVGMRYVKLLLAVNDEGNVAEFEAWEKYYPLVANKDVADNKGYFWIVKEAKLIEGSAVPIGSNSYTPTIEVKQEPLKNTQKTIEPLKNTPIDYDYLKTNLKIIN